LCVPFQLFAKQISQSVSLKKNGVCIPFHACLKRIWKTVSYCFIGVRFGGAEGEGVWFWDAEVR